jgi:putative ABC transport system substrate-binding protein
LANTGVTLQEVTVSATNEVLQGAQALMARGIDVFWVTGDNTVTQALEGPIKVALDSRKPLILNDPEFVERGALMAVGIAWRTTGIAAGKMAARVLRGEDPQGIPIVNVAEQKTVINKEVAQKLGINFPPDILAEAER